jgi:hypothetical protein
LMKPAARVVATAPDPIIPIFMISSNNPPIIW